jgi:predicted RNA-binding protein Jag
MEFFKRNRAPENEANESLPVEEMVKLEESKLEPFLAKHGKVVQSFQLITKLLLNDKKGQD